MKKVALYGWAILVFALLMEYCRDTVFEPVFDAAGTTLLCYVAAKCTDKLIFWYIFFLSLGKLLDSIQHPYLGFEYAELINIVVSTTGVLFYWYKRNKDATGKN